LCKKLAIPTIIVDTRKLINLVLQDKKWSDIGINDLYGKISIISNDPTKSNSGNMFAGLLADLLNKGEVVDDTSVDSILPQVRQVFDRLGYMEPSSADLFDQYLNTGLGANYNVI